jgi:hypothetical protein
MCSCGGSMQKDDCNQVAYSTSRLVNQPRGVPVMCGCHRICSIVFLLNYSFLTNCKFGATTTTSTSCLVNQQSAKGRACYVWLWWQQVEGRLQSRGA